MTPGRRTGPRGRDGTGPHVAIVGGGASGVLMATQLLSRPGGRFRVTIIEQRNLLGCGLAYSSDDPHHLLNTRVRNMSAFPDDRATSPAGSAAATPPRTRHPSSAARPTAPISPTC